MKLVFLKKTGIIIQIITVLISGSLFSQSKESCIELDLIKREKVREFIIEQHIDKLDNFFNIKASWKLDSDESSYHKHVKVFRVKSSLDKVWECYKKADPVEIWNSRKIDFGLLISKYSNSLLYETKGSFSEIDTGQVYFLNLKLLKGIFNIPVAFEIINIDESQKVIEFSYIDGNISKGKQTIYFIELEDGSTQIVHRSYFRSNSNLRDNIYPIYHKKIIKDFHRNMRRNIEQ